ncbi:MAG: hypothetical protein HY726_12175 [Candidatus Rokubacteria bacterium]|nr:hypothetical protein [Candidatus Rokubacteria bacterium]
MRCRSVAVAVSLACLIGSAPLSAASFSLTPEETREAIRVGQRSVVAEELGSEWQLVNPNGESLTVMTPFYRLALAARNAAFKNEMLKPREVESLLNENKGRILFSVKLHGNRVDFARWYAPVLVLPDREEVKPAFVQNERTALRLESGRYLARCLYSFPTEGLRPTARVTLLVRDLERKDVARFTVDLSAMR